MELGMRDGDFVVGVGDKQLDRLNDGDVIREIVFNDARTIQITRNGNPLQIEVPDDYVARFASQEFRNKDFYAARSPLVFSKVNKNGPAYEAGLQVGDKVVGVDGMQTLYFVDFKRALTKYKDKLVNVGVERDGKVITLPVKVNEKGAIGVQNESLSYFFDLETEKYGAGKALVSGYKEGVSFITNQMVAFGKMFSGEIKMQDSLGGFGTISGLFSKTWNWRVFWLATAILSLILGFMNLLPIPALDGGHVVFLIYEIVTGRKPSDKVMEIATIVGFVIIVGLVLIANGLDLWRAR
jgi:regulator of sigma E protease